MVVWISSALGAGLDLLEVGGAFGTPAATNPTAIWWNPAGLAIHGGTQIYAEGAPTFGGVRADRANPDYGELGGFDGFPSSYDYGGEETFSSVGVVPFLGASTDFGLEGLGVGLALFVPTARSASTDEAWGPNRFAAREGSIRAAHLALGASYRIAELVGIGVSGSLVDSSWYGESDASALPDLVWTVENYVDPLPEYYEDGLIEQQDYTTTVTLGGLDPDGGHGALTDRTFTFGAGVYVTPTEVLGISLAWNQGVKLANEGDVTFRFQCPPDADVNGQAAATDSGLCDTTIHGTTTLAYELPSRLHVGVALLPVDRVRLELMGAWVGWSVLDDYVVTPLVSPADIPAVDAAHASPAALILNRERLLARGARDSFWVGFDGKVDLAEELTVGGRVTFDRAAIPTEYVTASNIDADAVILQATTQYRPVAQLGLGLSYSYAASGAREVTDSVFSQDIARADPTSSDFYDSKDAIDRTFYPSANGTYALGIHRIGVSVQARFGGSSSSL